MFDTDDFSIDCATCIGHGTTACSDCVVSHLLANDDGPIDFITTSVKFLEPVPTPDEVAIALLIKAGLVDEQPVFVPMNEFVEAGTKRSEHLTVVR